MKVYLRNTPNNEEGELISDISDYITRIHKRTETLKSGRAELVVSDFSLEAVNENARFSEILPAGFFTGGNAYRIPVYLADEKTGIITDACIIRKVEENISKGLCTITVTSPLAELDKELICCMENVTPAEAILRCFETLEIDKELINHSVFENAHQYYLHAGVFLSILLTAEDKKNGFHLVNEIVEMTGDSLFIQSNLIHYYLNKEYDGSGGLTVSQKDVIGNIKVYREDGADTITCVKYKISDTETYQMDISEINPGWEYLKRLYKNREHYRDYSGAKVRLNITLPSFYRLAKSILFKRGERKLVVELTLPIKYSFLRIGDIVNLSIKERNIFTEPFEMTGKEMDYEQEKMTIRCMDLNIYPHLFPVLNFRTPASVENLSVWVNENQIHLYWEKVTKDLENNPINISYYRLYYGVYPGCYESYINPAVPVSPIRISGDKNEYIITGFDTGKKYYFSISAVSINHTESELCQEIFCRI